METGLEGENVSVMIDVCTCCSDVLCGQLHCTPAEQIVLFQTMTFLTIQSYVKLGSTRYECDSVIVDVGTQYTDPGLAPDGAKCGDGKVLLLLLLLLLTDGGRVSIAIIRLCDSDCLCVRTIKPKRLKLKSPNSAQG